MTEPIKVLFIDDEAEICDLVSRMLGGDGPLTITSVLSADEASRIIPSEPPDVIVSDYAMPGTDGITLLKDLRKEGNTIPFIILSGRGNERMVIEALNSQADFYLDKGEDIVATIQLLRHFIAQAVGRRRADEAILTYSRHLEELVQDRTRRLVEAQRQAIIGDTAFIIGQDLKEPLEILEQEIKHAQEIAGLIPPAGEGKRCRSNLAKSFATKEEQLQSMKRILRDLQESVRPRKATLHDISFREYYETVIRTYPFPRGTVLSADIPLDAVIKADPALLDRIFFHILNIASDTTPRNGTLSIQTQEYLNQVAILIADREGDDVGTTHLLRPLLSSSPGGKMPGFPVIQHLLAVQGGDIAVSSSPHGGTLIVLRFPRGQLPPARPL